MDRNDDEALTMSDRGAPRASMIIGISFCASALASVALAVVYALGGQPQLEGGLLGVSLGGLAVGLITFGRNLLPGGHFVEERKQLPPGSEEQPEAASTLAGGATQIGRRRFLATALGGALGALGIAALFPIRSLGTRPGRSLFVTRWEEGVRVVTADGLPVRVDELPVHGFITVFPGGHTEAADSQTVLIRLPDDIEPPGPDDWSVEGIVAFSKICTHAGCPVGLYQSTTQELFCPCHQSVFSVPEGATPTAGPATRPLPQLPLSVDDAGYLVARGDFEEPVGPGFWGRPK
jgi:ubiquinol-cytochrome c reductase iron-sulfur subunit